MDFYGSNMALLEKNHKSFWDKFRVYEPELDTELIYASNGLPNLKARTKEGKFIVLHHEEDPEIEVAQFLDMIPEHASGVVLMTGMGLGYSPQAILDRRKKIHYLAVFDLVPEIFLAAIRYMDLSDMLSDPRLILGIGPKPDIDEILQPANLALQLENTHSLNHVPSFALDNEAYEKLSSDVYRIANHYNLGGGALLESGRTYTDNRLRHLTSMYKNYIIDDLEGKFEGIPAVLVAGGPSLDINIHLLSELKNKAVIIAVDSTLPALAAKGVLPDFMTAIDPFDMIYEKFAKVLPEMENTALIASAWVAPKVAKVFKPDQIFWTFAGRDMENWMMELMGGRMATGGASTVAHLNFLAAVVMGCSPIIFVGQDLSYVGKASHAENTTLKYNKGMEGLLTSKEIHWVDGVDGGKVPTDRLFLNYKEHFEKMISRHDGICINATAQGAHIEGTQHMALDQVIEKYCLESRNIKDIIFSAKQTSRSSKIFLDEFRSFIRKSSIILKEIDRADNLQIKVSGFLKKSLQDGERFKNFDLLPENIKKQIRQMDKHHRKIDSFGKIWGIVEELTMKGLKESERQKLLISGLKDDPDQYMEWLLKNIERLDYLSVVRKKELKYFKNCLLHLIHHLDEEKKILGKINQAFHVQNPIEALAELYFSSKDYSLLEQLCHEFADGFKDSALFMFYMGCVALLKNDFSRAEDHFKNAGEMDTDIQDRIKIFRESLGNEYIQHANFFNTYDDDTVRLMLIKGLKYGGGKSLQASQLKILIQTDLKDAASAIEFGTSQKAISLVDKWILEIEAHDALKSILEKEICARLHVIHGNALVREQKFEKAVEQFKKALRYVPDEPQYHLLISDSCFAANDFDHGIRSLNNAVALDRSYAQYWENMGDNLCVAGKFQDALAAFEQYMIAIPENRFVLKKIAKCYMELGELEAAREALRHLKQS